MKQPTRIRLYSDQGLYRDLGFLLLATGFLLVKVFDVALPEAVLYSPLIVFGSFALLVGGSHLVLGLLSLFETLGEYLGFSRGPRY